jgi:sugar phosphate isomerase/epimerase
MKKITHCINFLLGNAVEQDQVMRELVQAGEKYVVLTSSLLREGCRSSDYLIDFYKRLQHSGLEFADAHAPWGTWSDPGLPDKEFRKIMLSRQRMALDFCRIFGVTTLTYHTGNTLNSVFGRELTLDDYYAALIASLEELLPLAERCSVVIALENQWTPLNHSSILLRIVEYFNSPFLGLCYDSGHGNLTEKGSADVEKSCVPAIWNDLGVPVQWEEHLIEKFAPYLVNCHLHDNCGLTDDHLLPGMGNVDWERIRKVLENAPHLRCIQNECVLPADMPVADFCRTFRKNIRINNG